MSLSFIFVQVVESRSREANPEDSSDFGAIRVSTLTLVDLAGSERIAKTGDIESCWNFQGYTMPDVSRDPVRLSQ